MNDMDWHNVRGGTRVKIMDGGKWESGEVTILRENEAKVLFDNGDLDYTYYKKEELELDEHQ